VPASGLFDFVENFAQFAPKTLKRNARDRAIVDTLGHLDPDVLAVERKRPDIIELLVEAEAEMEE